MIGGLRRPSLTVLFDCARSVVATFTNLVTGKIGETLNAIFSLQRE